MRNISKIAVSIMFSIIVMCFINTVSAANLGLDINFDGKTIKMTSTTPEMVWNIDNILPGETDETILTISNIGTRDVEVTFVAKIEEGNELADVINVKVIKLANENQIEDEEFFEGSYSEMVNCGLSLQKGGTQKYKIITTIPESLGNEFQKKECEIKLSFVASGIEDKGQDIIITDKVEDVQTGESKTVYIVIGVVVVAVVILISTFFVGKKKEKVD